MQIEPTGKNSWRHDHGAGLGPGTDRSGVPPDTEGAGRSRRAVLPGAATGCGGGRPPSGHASASWRSTSRTCSTPRGIPEVMAPVQHERCDGQADGPGDAGQGWHTDMSYSQGDRAGQRAATPSACRGATARPIGDTQFRNMHAAYDDLPAEVKHAHRGPHRDHDFAKFWDMMRIRPGSHPRAADARAAREEAAGVAADRAHAPDHRARACSTAIPATRCSSTGMDRAESDELLELPVPPPGAGEVLLRARTGPRATC